MNHSWLFVMLIAGAYLLGSVPFGLLVARMRGVDIRSQGSGNVGATNVGRVLGRKWGVLVFLLDAGKGALCTLAGGAASHSASVMEAGRASPDWWWLASGFACVAGSVAPIYLRFRGGKGVAASVGAILGIYPYLTLPALAVLALWAVVVRASGYVSLGSIAAAVGLPLAFVGICVARGWRVSEHYPLLGLCVALAALILLRHRENIGRLLAGRENRIGAARTAQDEPSANHG